VIEFIKKWQQMFWGLAGGGLTAILILLLNRPAAGTPITLLPPPATVTPVPVRVHITGAVNAPGLYALPQNSILQDAIDAAGGFTSQADPSGLNLAELLTDGKQIAIPTILPTLPPTPTLAPTATTGPGTPTPTPEPTATPANVTSSQPPAASGQLVNINTATLAELDTLPRIGPAIAQRIIDYREANGPFTTIEQIMNIKGIGPATFDKLKDLITVK
jgi:competence protein ComEA